MVWNPDVTERIYQSIVAQRETEVASSLRGRSIIVRKTTWPAKCDLL